MNFYNSVDFVLRLFLWMIFKRYRGPSLYDGQQVDQHHYHNPLLAELLMQYFWFIGPVTSLVVCFGVWFYPTVRLVLEMRNGIGMTEKSYPRLKPIFFAGRDRAVPAGTAE